MATATVVGLSTGKRFLTCSLYGSDISDKLSCINDYASLHYQTISTKNLIVAKKSSGYSPTCCRSQPIKQQLKEHVNTTLDASTPRSWFEGSNDIEKEEEEEEEEEEDEDEDDDDDDDEEEEEEEIPDLGHSVEALLLLQKSMLEKQWNLSFERTALADSPRYKTHEKIPITGSGVSARQRRINAKKRNISQNKVLQPNAKHLLHNRLKGYVRGVVSEELLSHSEVVYLSEKIKGGVLLEEHKSRLKERLGCEPSDKQLATSLRISRAELQSMLLECSLAREKLAMSNIRLVMSIAQRYNNMGAEMSDLVQGGLIGLLRGIEKFDSSKGFKLSTYVYWWIRQGVSRTLMENSRTLRLPVHLHERLGLIRKAKIRLEMKGIVPSIDRIAESLNMSQRKVRNATEAVRKVYSLDRDAFPSLNGLPGETHHSYIADRCLENNPWHEFDEWALKDEVNRLIDATLGERERDIIRLYHGLDKETLSWEDISKRIGLSRERVRQVGLVALEKLKTAARRRKVEAMLVKH